MLNASIGVNTVEQELSTLSSEIRKGVPGMTDKLESVGHRNQNPGQHQTGISPQLICSATCQTWTMASSGNDTRCIHNNVKRTHSHSHKTDYRPPPHDNDSLGDEDFHDHAFDHPSNYQNRTWIWIPKDKLGLSTILVEELNV